MDRLPEICPSSIPVIVTHIRTVGCFPVNKGSNQFVHFIQDLILEILWVDFLCFDGTMRPSLINAVEIFMYLAIVFPTNVQWCK